MDKRALNEKELRMMKCTIDCLERYLKGLEESAKESKSDEDNGKG